MDSIEQHAQRLLANIEATYVPTHNYVEVSASDFPHLNLRFYDQVRDDLKKAGYRYISDLEDTSISSAPGTVLKRIMIRTMLSSDGSVMAAAYDLKVKFFARVVLALLRRTPRPVIDFETEYSNGSFLVTTNAEAASAIKTPPMVMTEYLPASTPTEAILRAHIERMQAFQSALPEATPKTQRTQADMLIAQNRMNALKAAYREQLGGISAEELAALSVGWSDVHLTMHKKIQAIRSRRAAA